MIFLQESEKELTVANGDISKCRNQLESCPRDGACRVNVDKFEELIVQLEQSRNRSDGLLRETRNAVAERWRDWKLFDDSVSECLMFIKRLSYARNMAILRGSPDLQRLLASLKTMEVSVTIPKQLFRNCKIGFSTAGRSNLWRETVQVACISVSSLSLFILPN